jgi:hypothetical protein
MCDQCFNIEIGRPMGLPGLPEPPRPFELNGPDGRRHRFGYRIWRAPTGIAVELEEATEPVLEGYHFAVLGAHDDDAIELFEKVRLVAEREVSRLYLENHQWRPGWIARDDIIGGWLTVGEDHVDGDPYDVVVDGRLLSWEEFGRSLEPFEGWRFRLQIEERYDQMHHVATELIDQLSADIIDISQHKRTEVLVVPTTGIPTIADVFADFLSEQRQRLAPRTFRSYEEVIDLLTHSLNNYGHQSLSDAERKRFEPAFETDPEAFVHLFGPEKISQNLGEFLGYFMIQKVMAGDELLRASGTVTKRLVKWLGQHGYIDEADAQIGAELASDAVRDLPKAEKLSRLLFEQSRHSRLDLRVLDDDDYIEDYLTIERIEPGVLWFGDALGPVKVTRAISDLAQPGWSVFLVLGRVGEGKPWQVVQSGVVYP